jgi:hypothetical protein
VGDTRCLGGEVGELGWGCLLFLCRICLFFFVDILARVRETKSKREREREMKLAVVETVRPHE